MRGSTALLLAGAVAIVAGTTAPVLAADDAARVTPEPAIAPDGAPPEDESGAESVDAVEPEPAEPAGSLDRPSLEAEADDRSSEGGRDARSRERDSEQAKQPLAGASVTMKNIKFKPKSVTINAGDTVTWTNRDTAQHNAVDQGEFKTRLLDEGQSDTVTIDEPGTYNYVCTVHAGMKGKLIAQSSGGGSSGTGGTAGTSSSGGTGGTGGTSSASGGSVGTLGGGGSPASGGSSGTLPNTGQEQLPLLILGAALIVAGLLTRAFHEYWIWR